MIKLLHTADWQIGKQYGQFDTDEAALLAEARFTVVERLAQLAIAQGVDAVLVAGDVFDAQGVADKTIHRLFNSMAAFSGPWVLIPGNHDAGLVESVWTRAARLNAVPPNAHVCLRPEPLLLPSLGLAVLPAPLTQRHTYNDLTEWFAAARVPPGLFRVGLAHGSVQGILAEDIDSSNPIAAARAEQAALDYLALGDWHGCKQVDARTWYSGTPETDRFRANASGQALIVSLVEPGGLPSVVQHATGQYRWREDTVDLQVPSDIDALLQQLADLTSADVVALNLTGRIDLPGRRRLVDAIGQARGRTRSLAADLSALRFEPTSEDFGALQADGYLGDVIANLRAAQEDAAAESAGVARDALALLAGILDERRAGARAAP
ncbi:DNA repair exonuclease [Roseateles sp.]|uniref:metallophosphoesterase family protein n=1 Tax=Roseateles sp. TaxID=1971397 RepID=UPI0032631075